MSYMGRLVRVPFTFHHHVGGLVLSGTEGIVMKESKDILSILIADKNSSRMVHVPKSMVDISDGSGSEVAWVNE